MLKSLWIEKSFAYDGTQLRSLYGYLDHKVLGDSVVAWRGPCEISFEHMVDGEDLLQQSPIRGSDMLHFIVEIFQADLLLGVSFQRLFASICLELLRAKVLSNVAATQGRTFRRDGDDIYWGDKKFSISIATVSPASALIHFAVNCRNEGTPVPTCALEDFDLEPRLFAIDLMTRFAEEFDSIQTATRKVKWVK